MTQARFDRYVLETLMPDLVLHDHQPSAFLVYLQLSYRGGRRSRVRVSHQQMADLTGLSKSAVQGAIRVVEPPPADSRHAGIVNRGAGYSVAAALAAADGDRAPGELNQPGLTGSPRRGSIWPSRISMTTVNRLAVVAIAVLGAGACCPPKGGRRRLPTPPGGS